MARVEVTDYETVEKTDYKWECDECKQVVEDEDIIKLLYTENEDVNPSVMSFKPDETKCLCEECVGLKRALKIRETEEYLKARWEGFRGSVDFFTPVMTGLLGASMGAGMMWLIVTGQLKPESSIGQLLASGFVYWLCVGVAAVILTYLFLMMDA